MPVKLFCGVIAQKAALEEAITKLEGCFGRKELESACVGFDSTDYYEDEMGRELVRKWLCFEGLRERGFLALAKHITLGIETELSFDERRRANLDPGYLDNAQVVLATSKNYAHRIYIGMGYYAEVTLIFKHGTFEPLEWTYPDYRSSIALDFFARARNIYHREVRALEA